MNKTRLFMLVGILLLTLALVGMALAADNAQKPTPEKPTAMSISAPGTGQTESLSGSLVAFDPSVGGAEKFIPGEAQTFCFRSESFTTDWGYVYNNWIRFPSDWTVTNVYVQGTPSCTGGGTFQPFSWSFVTPPYEVNIAQSRYHAPTDHCTAYYCFDVISGTGTPNAEEDWAFNGDDYGSPPYHPCSIGNYNPPGITCDERINDPAIIEPLILDPIMLTPATDDATGCGYNPTPYTKTVWNNTGYTTQVDLSYEITQGTGVCTGPALVELATGTTQDITVNLTPFGPAGTTVVCEVTAVDSQEPANFATATVSFNIISGGPDPAGWQNEPIAGAFGQQWGACAVGTNPDAEGEVGYQIGGLNTSGGVQANLQMYDPHLETWAQLAPAHNAGFGYVAGWIEGKLYVAGGSTAAFTGINDLDVYDPVSNTWDDVTPANLPLNRLGGAGGVAPCHTTGVGECLYVMGGTPDGFFTSFSFSAFEYDPLTNIWTQLTSIPGNPANYGTALGGGLACNGKVYIGGDYRGIADFFGYDPTMPSGSEWTQLASIPPAAGKMTVATACVESENAIYFIGGDSVGYWGDLYNNKVFRYNIGTNTWDGPIDQHLNTGLLGSCGLFMDSKLWTFGGTHGAYAITPAPHESLAYLTCVVPPDINVIAPPLDKTLFPNETATISFTIQNLGGLDLTFEITDDATWLSETPITGTILPGESMEDIVTFDSTDLMPGFYTATIEIGSNDPDTPVWPLAASLTVNTPVSDLSLAKFIEPEEARVGDMITYTLVVTNAGPQTAFNVMLVDTLPAQVAFNSASPGCTNNAGEVTCLIDSLAVDETATITIVVDAIGGGDATNTATVESDSTDPNLANNTAEVSSMILFNFYLPIGQKQ